MFWKSRISLITSLMFLIFSAGIITERCTTKKIKNKFTASDDNEYVGDKACMNCHKNEFHDWQKSDHFRAMEIATDSTVEGDFNNAKFSADGITSLFFKKDSKFFINTQGEDGSNHDYEILYTFGYYPLQQYLVKLPGGRMQVTRESWDAKQKRWFHQYSGQKIPAHDWLHWTGNAQNWNTMCASCHSTNLQKHYDINTDTYNTTYSVMNVSCESCHGAGKQHIEYAKSDDYLSGKKVPGSFLQQGKGADHISQINTCAPCHARKSDISASLIQSNELMDNYIPEIPTTEFFYADGQVNAEDYTYTSFLQSKMFRRGIKCSDCHNPHTGKTLALNNLTCLNCHAKTFDNISHTFHQMGTEGSLCKNCHMPGKIYMGNDLRHDHSLRVPRPDLTVKYGTPNACTNCHSNKSAQWAADIVIKWYGPERKYHFADDLIPGSMLNEKSEAHLIKLLGDTTVPDIIKATSAYYLGNINTQTSGQALIKCLNSDDAQIRYRALISLSNFSDAVWIESASPLLKDKVRAVRIVAAELFLTVPEQEIPTSYKNSFTAARNELHDFLIYQADFSVGNLMLADYYLKLQDYNQAEKFYVRGLKKDSMMNYARLNLSSVYSSLGNNNKALEVLKTALKIDPGNDRIYYNLALLYYEINNKAEAGKAFAKAIALKTNNPKVYYNYGLLLNENKKYKEAAITLQTGLTFNPYSSELYYVLTLVYINSGDTSNARKTGQKLKQLNPNNPDYLQLFTNLGI